MGFETQPLQAWRQEYEEVLGEAGCWRGMARRRWGFRLVPQMCLPHARFGALSGTRGLRRMQRDCARGRERADRVAGPPRLSYKHV